MKTLQESILSSTGTGKIKEIGRLIDKIILKKSDDSIDLISIGTKIRDLLGINANLVSCSSSNDFNWTTKRKDVNYDLYIAYSKNSEYIGVLTFTTTNKSLTVSVVMNPNIKTKTEIWSTFSSQDACDILKKNGFVCTGNTNTRNGYMYYNMFRKDY